jgi:hypothetical protein
MLIFVGGPCHHQKEVWKETMNVTGKRKGEKKEKGFRLV